MNKLIHSELWNDQCWLLREVIKAKVNQDVCYEWSLEELRQMPMKIGGIFIGLTDNYRAEELIPLLERHIELFLIILTKTIENYRRIPAIAEWKQNTQSIAECYVRYSEADLTVLQPMFQEYTITLQKEMMAIVKGQCEAAREEGALLRNNIHEIIDYINSKF